MAHPKREAAMAESTNLIDATSVEERHVDAAGFDWLLAILILIMEGGFFLDLWAHSHGRVGPTFFTPWHGVFYAGFAAIVVSTGLYMIQTRSGSGGRFLSLPTGYELLVPGILLFLLSGLSDYLWHSFHGFDLASDAPISPSHLGLIIGMGMIVIGPLRAEWKRSEVNSPHLPAILSGLAFLSICTITIQFAHPTAKVWAIPEVIARFPTDPITAQSLALSGMLLHTVIWVGFCLAVARRWSLPIGTLTFLLTANAAVMCLSYDEYRLILAALLAGIAADVLLFASRRVGRPKDGWHMIAWGIPLVYYLSYFATLNITGTVWWQPHVSLGAIVLTCCCGWLLGTAMRTSEGRVF
jgi:hypothetical protein